MKLSKNKKIYTYLCQNSPQYFNLCIKTWKKSLKNKYEIIILNEENISSYLPDVFLKVFSDKRIKENKVPYFYSYLSSVILHKNGGIFLQPDMIMTKEFETQLILLENCDFVAFSNGKNNICSGCIMANKHSKVLDELIRRYRFMDFLLPLFVSSENFILNDVIKYFPQNDVLLIDSEDAGYCMEKSMYGVSGKYLYEKYYFSDICNIDEFFNHTRGLTALNDNFTPQKYRKMNENEFLSQNILLSYIFKEILTPQTN